MKAILFSAAVMAGLASVGCSSAGQKPQTTASANQVRPEVMDLNDSPARPIPPAARPAPTPPAPEPAPAAPTPPPAPAVAAPRKHVVAAKDTLYAIAKQYYGDSKRWPEIVKANPGLVPDRMPVGKTIIIP